MRACVCIRGHHATANGVKVCPFILRIHVYAGKSDLRLYHTFVFDQDADHMELSAIGMKFPLDLGEDPEMAFGIDQGVHQTRQASSALVLQSTDTDYALAEDGGTVATGGKARGWATMCGRKASAAVAVRHFWQEYPKGIALDGDGTIDVQIWPARHDGDLSFSTPFKEEAIVFGRPTATRSPPT